MSRSVYVDPFMSFEYVRGLHDTGSLTGAGQDRGIQPTMQGLEGVTFRSESGTKRFEPFPPTAFAR